MGSTTFYIFYKQPHQFRSVEATLYVLYVEQQSQSRIAGGRNKEELLLDIVINMNNKLPPLFNLELPHYKYPVQYEESINSILV
jgi:hypothetical protein